MSFHRFHRAFAVLTFVFGMPLAAQAAGLTDILMSKFGVTQPQAAGGAGSIFKLAKSQMTMDNFTKLANAVPGMDKYLAAAPKFALPAVTPVVATAPAIAAAPAAAAAPVVAAAPAAAPAATAAAPPAQTTTGALTAKAMQLLESSKLGGTLKSAEALVPAFEKLGMKPGMVAKFMPVVVDYVKSSGGKATAKLLTGALSH